MKNKVKKILSCVPALIWMGIIFYFSSRQKVAVSGNYLVSFIFFKTLHIIEYGVLFLLWRFALYRNKYGAKIAAIISILYGVTDEIHQSFVPTREYRIRDVFIDSLGVFIFWRFLLKRIERIVEEKKLLRQFILF